MSFSNKWKCSSLTTVLLQVVVVLAGTNNHGNPAEEVAEGIMEICKTVRDKQPSADIVLLVSLFSFC